MLVKDVHSLREIELYLEMRPIRGPLRTKFVYGKGTQCISHDGGAWAFHNQEKYMDVLKFGTIRAGFRTFISYGAIVLLEVSIRKRCVIGAGAVVTKDIPDNSVVVMCLRV